MLAWTLVAATSVLLAGFSGLLTPVNLHDGAGTTVRDCVVSSISGLCGGGLLALACATMLPAAYERTGRGAAVMGLLAPTGFVASASAFHPFLLVTPACCANLSQLWCRRQCWRLPLRPGRADTWGMDACTLT